MNDFQAVALMATVPFMMQAHPKVPAKNLAEFIALAKQKPGTFTYATPGTGSISHLLGEMLQFEAGIKLIHVPYRGTAQGTTDLIGGQVDTNFGSVPAVIQSIKAGQLRALGVTSARRISVLPDVPTFAESGFPGFDVDPWWGILAPAGTDAAIVNKVNADVARSCRARTCWIPRRAERSGAHRLARRVPEHPGRGRGEMGQGHQRLRHQDRLIFANVPILGVATSINLGQLGASRRNN